jgi:hypothetical protein
MANTLIGELVVDYQGGGIFSSPEAISYLRQPPIESEKVVVTAIVDDLMEAVTHLGPHRDLLYAVLFSTCERNLERAGSQFSVTEEAVMETTINGVCELLQRRADPQDVVVIAAMGAAFMARTATWESLR